MMTSGDMLLGQSLWEAYSNNDFHKFETLSYTPSSAFKYLPEVCCAHLNRYSDNGWTGRPEQTIKDLMENSSMDFPELFSAFSAKEGIYGFGDVQVRRMYDALKKQAYRLIRLMKLIIEAVDNRNETLPRRG